MMTECNLFYTHVLMMFDPRSTLNRTSYSTIGVQIIEPVLGFRQAHLSSEMNIHQALSNSTDTIDNASQLPSFQIENHHFWAHEVKKRHQMCACGVKSRVLARWGWMEGWDFAMAWIVNLVKSGFFSERHSQLRHADMDARIASIQLRVPAHSTPLKSIYKSRVRQNCPRPRRVLKIKDLIFLYYIFRKNMSFATCYGDLRMVYI